MQPNFTYLVSFFPFFILKPEITQKAMEIDKKIRTFLACDPCRRSKLRCIAADEIPVASDPSASLSAAKPKCQRCSKLDLDCQYTPKRSQLKKRLKLPTATVQTTDFDYFSNTIHNLNRQYRKKPHALDSIILPNKTLLLEVVSEFFENQYHSNFSFIHRKSYMDWIRSDNFENEFFNYDDPAHVPQFTPCTLLAILALVSRHNDQLSQIYGTFDHSTDPQRYIPDFQQLQKLSSSQSSINASRYFAYYSRLLLKDVFDTPSVQRVQSLILLSSHEWSEGNYSRSYLYIGIAARMGSILGMCSPSGVCYQNDTFISKESKRRTIWAVYMMDRCNSSGRNRNHAIKIEDIEVPLPCPEVNFQEGIPIEYPSYNDCFKGFDKLTSLDITIITLELWSKIAKWVGDIGAKNSNLSPMDPESIFNKIHSDLELLKEKLPAHLHIENIDSELSNGNLNFGYLHQLLYLCEIFLTREYFYYNAAISQDDHLMFTKKLINSLQKSTELNVKLINAQKFVYIPFAFFQVFTNCVTCLSISSILHNDELISIGLQNMAFLSQHISKDQLVQTWFKICQQLQDYLSVTNTSNLNINSEKFKNLLNDFGECDIPERLSINEPQKCKKVDLHDILNSNVASTPGDSTASLDHGSSASEEGSFTMETDNNKYIEIDKYFKNWEKIIPNWNDVFIEFDETNLETNLEIN
jgi:hypothetical protein